MAMLALFMALAQDPAEIQEWVRKLGDEDFATREEAERRLAQIGGAAASELEKASTSPDPEVRERSLRILAAIERNEGRRRLLGIPLRIALDRTASVREILEELRDAGPIDTARIIRHLETEVSVRVANGTAFDVLDALCRSTGGRIDYRVEGDRIRFIDEPFDERPSFRHEAFRVRVARIERRGGDQVAIAGAVEPLPTWKTIGDASVTIDQVVDGRGRGAERSPGPDSVWLCDPGSDRLRSVQGTASFVVAVRTAKVRARFVEGRSAAAVELGFGWLTVAPDRAGPTRLAMALRLNYAGELPEEAFPGLVAPGSGVAVLRSGEQRAIRIEFAELKLGSPRHLAGPPEGGLGGAQNRIEGSRTNTTAVYRIDLGTVTSGEVAELRLEVSDGRPFRVSFEIRDVKLP
jgi:hypothetical protein